MLPASGGQKKNPLAFTGGFLVEWLQGEMGAIRIDEVSVQAGNRVIFRGI